MGNFADTVLEKFKDPTTRGGCVKKAIYILITAAIIVSVCLFTVCSSMPKTDEDTLRFWELINKTYQPFSPQITQTDKTNLNTKVQTNTSCSSGDLVVGDNLNLNRFLSSDTAIIDGLNLSAKDLAVLLQYSWQTEENVSVYDVSMITDGGIINWSILLKFSFQDEKTTSNELHEVFLTFQAQIYKNLATGEYELMKYNLVVNRLEGEENDFVVKKIKEMLSIEDKTLIKYATYPFAFADKQALVWNVNFTFDSAQNLFCFG